MFKTAFIFPGQGSQFAGMGKSLAGSYPEASRIFEEADSALGFSISQVCFEGPEEELKRTEITQPALLTVSVAALAVLRGKGVTADYIAGHSLGEYSALVAAGSLKFEDALRLVQERGRYMQEAVPDCGGAMAAVLKLPEGRLDQILAEARQGEVVSAANLNSPDQIVLAGHAGAVERAVELARAAGARRAVILPVSAPFHCLLMEPAQKRLKADLDATEFRDLSVPLINNWQAREIWLADEAREGLYQQVPNPVLWGDSVRTLAASGVTRFIEVGAGGVLTGLLRNIDPSLVGFKFGEAADWGSSRRPLRSNRSAAYSKMEQVVPRSLQIGPVNIAPATVLAPMAGVTDTVFRRLIRSQGGCGLIMTEFTSSHGVVAAARATKPTRTFRYLYFDPEEHPISAQLFGSDPGVMADAARHCQDMGFDIVDINFGCPVKKVVTCNGGSGLLRDLPLVERILRSVRAAISIPLTMKFRAGWNDRELVTVRMAQLAEDCGLQAIALHPRTREQGYSGHADWTRIAEVKAAVKIPVIGNGDIVTPEDALRMVRETGCDAVMVGRTASSNPWIFRQIEDYASTGRYETPPEKARYEIMRLYYGMLEDHRAMDAVGKMKQFATYFTHGVRNGAQLRASIYHAHNTAQILGLVDAFFERELAAPVLG